MMWLVGKSLVWSLPAMRERANKDVTAARAREVGTGRRQSSSQRVRLQEARIAQIRAQAETRTFAAESRMIYEDL